MDMQTKAVNWLELPSDLLDLISDKLTHVKDFIRFGAVCRSWRSIYTNKHNHLPRHQLPVLMLGAGSRYIQPSQNFYDLSNKMISKFPSQSTLLCSWNYDEVRKPQQQAICRGSSQGWLVYQFDSQVHLLNPFLSVDNEINLPNYKRVYGKHCTLNRPVLSADPSSNSNYILFGSCIPDDKSWVPYALVFYKFGDNAWKTIPLEKNIFIQDIVYFRDLYYVLEWTQSTNLAHVLVCDVSSSDHPHLTKLPVAPKDLEYIVESAGDLLGVRRIYGKNETEQVRLTVGFEVFKMDEEAYRWVEIKSLGGRSLFVGTNASISLLASEFNGCKPNRIYFTDYIYRLFPPDMSVYNMEDGSIEKDFPVWSRKLMADYWDRDELESPKLLATMPIWIEPTLSGCLM